MSQEGVVLDAECSVLVDRRVVGVNVRLVVRVDFRYYRRYDRGVRSMIVSLWLPMVAGDSSSSSWYVLVLLSAKWNSTFPSPFPTPKEY